MVEVAHIKKRYGKRVILEDITFSVNPGESIALIGKNGCGKSTLLKILAGVLNAQSGDFYYYNQNKPKKRSQFCGYVPQENPLLEQLTVKDNLFLWGGRQAMLQQWVLKDFQLEELLHTPVERLSGGMKRRLSIACALMKNPSILLLDEPTAALDFFYKEHMLNWLESYKKRNGIVIMATHEEQEILSADRCFFMEHGVIKELKKDELSLKLIKEMIYERYI